MSEKRAAPLSRMWKRAKAGVPRQKVIASTIHAVRRSKPGSEERAREALITEAARQGVADLSAKELKAMTDAVVLKPKDAATQAVSKGTAGVKSLWASLQTAQPAWVDLPDDVAALNLRSDQTLVAVPIEVEAPEVVQRLIDELPAEKDGARTFDAWIALEPATDTAAVCVGSLRLGRVPAARAAVIRDELVRRRFWVGASVRDGIVTVGLPDQA
ncbi:MAG: hypothetical protein ACRDVG_03190 [Jatrophihabitantaceae bacterium]